MNPFERLLRELAIQLGTPLAPDSNQACRLDFLQEVSCQLELTASGDSILIGSKLGQLLIGTYREKMLVTALSVNGLHDTLRGTLAFSKKNEQLILFQIFPIDSLNGSKLFTFLITFADHAKKWKEAIKQNFIPTLDQITAPISVEEWGLR